MNSLEPTLAIAERFWGKVGKSDGCWEWLASLLPSGYGQIGYKGKNYAAHRVAWFLTHGPIPDHLCVLHRGDNRKCVRPGHLFLGTKADNTADMMVKGRHRSTPHAGESNGYAKLTDDAVQALRRRYFSGGISLNDLGKEFSISDTMAGFIVKRKKWGHLPVLPEEVAALTTPPAKPARKPTPPPPIRRGSANSSAKLTEAQVIEMRRRYDAGEVTAYRLGKEHGIDNALACRIVKRQLWTHIH